MRLADRIAQCRAPFVVQSLTDGALTRLSGASDFAAHVAQCPARFVLSDELTRLCTALAYSKGARNLECADLLRLPSERIWVEWCESAWLSELERYGFRPPPEYVRRSGRRGALISASRDGRSGCLRTFWSVGETDLDLLASSMEAYFDLDTGEDEEPDPPDEYDGPPICVSAAADRHLGLLRRCFRFRFERTWADYYRRAALSSEREAALAHHAL